MSFWKDVSFPNTRRFLSDSVTSVMPKRTAENLFLKLFSWRKIPLPYFVNPSIEELSDEAVVCKIPLRRATKNHLNSMYFGALAAGADLAAGLAAMAFIRESGKPISLIFKDIKGDFLKRAESDVYFSCDQIPDIKRLVQKTARSSERQNLSVHVCCYVLEDGIKVEVATFVLTLSLKQKVTQARKEAVT